MKKLCYVIEMTNKGMYIVFSCFLEFCIIISILPEIIKGEEFINIFRGSIMFILFVLFMFLILFIDDKKKDKIRKELLNIKKNGKKVEGNLVRFNRYTTRFKAEYRDHYTITVEYINPYTNERVEFETPELAFDAHHSLGSKKCSVYVWEDKVYVTDFIERRKGTENIWAKEDDYYKKIANLEKKEMPKIILGIVLFILLWLGLFIFLYFWKP